MNEQRRQTCSTLRRISGDGRSTYINVFTRELYIHIYTCDWDSNLSSLLLPEPFHALNSKDWPPLCTTLKFCLAFGLLFRSNGRGISMPFQRQSYLREALMPFTYFILINSIYRTLRYQMYSCANLESFAKHAAFEMLRGFRINPRLFQ